jgi:KipI family sensor histidine kinase inhibitor
MRCRLLNCGDAAVLVEVDGTAEVLALYSAVDRQRPAELLDLVPAARTLLVQVEPGTPLEPLRRRLQELAASTEPGQLSLEPDAEELVVPTVYDGEDLDEVATLTGLTVPEVVEAHTGTAWRVAFSGFAPGFAYLTGGDSRLQVPRRSEPRTRVPAGAVALAGEFSGVYPRESPGGWQLLGRTDLTLWDESRDPPALMTAGRLVRFEQVDS